MVSPIDLRAHSTPAPAGNRHALSVIVPFAHGDEPQADRLIRQLAAGTHFDGQVITCRAHGCRPLPKPSDWPAQILLIDVLSPRGRARQMNVAAGRANGEWLWFLHADSQLSEEAWPALNAFIRSDEDALGYFDLEFCDDGPRLTALNAWGANLRSRLFGLPFGDQGFILRRDRFFKLGGFDESLVFGEDHALVWRAHDQRLPIRRVGARLATSARKYAQRGWLRTTLTHLGLTAVQAWPRWRRLRQAAR